ncbi:cobalamin biosynthesis protein [Halobellus ruber]|uniref:Probable cobalamin biosynthesis protein CobD n=1 Tax=Halobellus ruber TaxID=2761102 RepID=A0A7J9SLH3_9EURY|nr:cobalamin biosynthesis protein [Halobellus ruber]
MPATAAAAVVLASVLDAAVAEPPARIHPVALFGRLAARVDRGGDGQTAADGWSSPRLAGVVAALILPLLAAGVAVAAVAAGTALHPWTGAAAAGLVLLSTTSLRRLLDRAREVIAASEGDLGAARRDLRALAGRDAASLDAAHVRSAAVESLAENLADGLVAPLVAFAAVVAAVGAAGVGSVAGADPGLAFGAGAAAWVKAVNTLDSMLGYRSKPVGWAPARLDDVVMWLPARLSACLLGVASGAPGLPFRRRVRRLAHEPASPNSGWPMATMVAALPARLTKPGAYDLDPGGIGGSGRSAGGEAPDAAPLPDAATATRAVGLTRRAGLLAAALAGVVAWF